MSMLVLDFDGTMTDAEAEGGPFRAGYLEDIATLCGADLDEVQALAARFEAEVAADPQSYGWLFHGHIVAPATVDPYLRVMPVARKVFDHYGCFMDEGDRTRLLDGILYKYNYTKTLNVFREGAGEVLHGLAGTATYIVTNSHTEHVKAKVADLGVDWLVERVHGRAKKYVIEHDFDMVPEAMTVEGLSRPILLRRANYYRVLARLLEDNGLDWSELLVVGDIFELDLALPLLMGARVGLVVNDFTPAYERDYLAAHPRGLLVHDIREIPGLLQGVSAPRPR